MRKWHISIVLFLSGLMLFAMVSLAQGSVALSWGVERIRPYCVWDNDNWNMSSSWDVDSGANAGQRVTIAVIDTGVDYIDAGNGTKWYHPDLAANIRGGAGFLYQFGNYYIQSDYKDYDGHGTQVIGIIAAIVNGTGANQSGIVGAAPEVNIYALKIESVATDAQIYELAAAINYSVDYLGAKIISMSLDTDYDYSVLHNSCNYANSRGALLFAPSSNDNPPGQTIHRYPELYDSVHAVGAIDQNDSRAAWSDYGSKLDFVAPGVAIDTTSINNGYAVKDGTSFAVPFASATAALIWSSKVDPLFDFQGGGSDGAWENEEVWAKMQNTTLDLPPAGKDVYAGWGLVNAWLATQRPTGDVNNDLKVDILDISIASKAYGSTPGSPSWDPRADVNIDKKVDVKDIALISKHFGQVDP